MWTHGRTRNCSKNPMKIAEALTASNEKLKMDPEKSEVSFNQGTTPSLQ